MKRNEKKVPGFDEIVFQNRNKEYGAYDLRKRYKSTACFSLLSVSALFSLAILLSPLLMPKNAEAVTTGGVVFIVRPENLVKPLNIPRPEIPKPAELKQQNKYVPPKIVDDTVPIETTLMTNDLAAQLVQNGLVTDKTDSLIQTVIPVETNNNEPFITVAEMPVFPGGNASLMSYIAENTKYPAEAVENNIQGKVFVKFAVEADGSVNRIVILRGVHPLLDQEAVRVISTLPLWKPGKQNGRPVPVWFSVPVDFQLR